MIEGLACPDCRLPLAFSENTFLCTRCGRTYGMKYGYVDFLPNEDFYAGEIPRAEMKDLIKNIDDKGFDLALEEFVRTHKALQEYLIDSKRADWICHCLGGDTLTCLDIGSGLGSISELLSKNYKSVYSLEAVKERIEFQKRRYAKSNLSNITLIRGNAIRLPFQDGFFDLVVCNGVLEWIGMMNTKLKPREAQLAFLKEVRRILKDNGCLYIGIENRYGLPFLLGFKDHSGLPYTSLMPRWMANMVVKKYGRAGGIYGDSIEKEFRGYFTYTYSIRGYNNLINDAGMTCKAYWVWPSYNQPYFSGRINDSVAIKGHVRHLTQNSQRFRRFTKIIYKMNAKGLGTAFKLFSPSFLFYCFKNELPATFDDLVVKNTKYENYLTISLGNTIIYVLYDKNSRPIKIARLRRGHAKFPEKLNHYDKTKPLAAVPPTESAWIEDWLPGRQLDPDVREQSLSALRWLAKFQNDTRSDDLNESHIVQEVNILKSQMTRFQNLNNTTYFRWLDEYVSYAKTIKIRRTSEHGDFWYGNILYDVESKQVHIIDWEYYVRNGNPLFDFVFFIILALDYSSQNIHELAGRLDNIPESFFASGLVNSHFGLNLRFDIIVRYVLLRFQVRKQIERGVSDSTSIKFNRILKLLLDTNV